MTPNDPASLDAWVRESAPRAVAYARSLLRDRHRAEDIVHDCYGRLLARRPPYDLPRDGTKLLMAAITNACINETQRAKPTLRLVRADDDESPDDPVDRFARPPEAPLEFAELNRAVAAALASLPETQRAAVELKSLGHSQAEIADMLGVSAVNAGVLIHRGRQKLAAALQAYLPEAAEEAS